MKVLITFLFGFLILVNPIFAQAKNITDSDKIEIIKDDSTKILEQSQSRMPVLGTLYPEDDPRVTITADPDTADLLCEFQVLSDNATVADTLTLFSGTMTAYPTRPTSYGAKLLDFTELGNHPFFVDCVSPIFSRFDSVFLGNLSANNLLVNSTNIGVNTSTTLTDVDSTEQCVSDTFDERGDFGDVRQIDNITNHRMYVQSNLIGSLITTTVKHFINLTEFNSTSFTFNATNTSIVNVTGFPDLFVDESLSTLQAHIVEVCFNATSTSSDGNGTIFGTIDSLEFDSNQTLNPEIVSLMDDIHVVSYTGTDNDGFIATFNITSEGILSSLIDIFEFAPVDSFETSLIRISDSIVAVSYDRNPIIFVKTINISSDGTIIGEIENISLNSTGINPFIINIDGGVFAVMFNDISTLEGVIQTINISSDGSISSIDGFTFNISGIRPIANKIDGDTLGIVFEDADNDGFVITLDIFSNGTINKTVNDILEFDPVQASFPKILNHETSLSNISIIVYEDSDGIGQVLTVDINDDGDIGVIQDTFEFGVTDGHTPDIVSVIQTIYAIAYEGVDVDGFIETIEILSNGTINNQTIDIFEFETLEAEQPEIINIFQNVYAVVFEDSFDHGIVQTINISTVVDVTFPDVTLHYNASVVDSRFLRGTGFFSTDFNGSIELHGAGEIHNVDSITDVVSAQSIAELTREEIFLHNNDFCLDNVTQRKIIEKQVLIVIGTDVTNFTVNETKDITCTFGCDQVTQKCSPDPFVQNIIFGALTLLLILIIFLTVKFFRR